MREIKKTKAELVEMRLDIRWSFILNTVLSKKVCV